MAFCQQEEIEVNVKTTLSLLTTKTSTKFFMRYDHFKFINTEELTTHLGHKYQRM